MILTMRPKMRAEHERTRHGQGHQQCVGFCAWGYSNVKHGDDKGNMGRAGARKKNGWHKGWYKNVRRKEAK